MLDKSASPLEARRMRRIVRDSAGRTATTGLVTVYAAGKECLDSISSVTAMPDALLKSVVVVLGPTCDGEQRMSTNTSATALTVSPSGPDAVLGAVKVLDVGLDTPSESETTPVRGMLTNLCPVILIFLITGLSSTCRTPEMRRPNANKAIAEYQINEATLFKQTAGKTCIQFVNIVYHDGGENESGKPHLPPKIVPAVRNQVRKSGFVPGYI
ncbi:hypothetical protein IW261DRAFT_1596952 [Armillaria novae-zelandiae]|uniref:Uncharacterized protein n=1 Tax=Armillaria novae-zelandiae TaxID=153914 RepID=A0AA39NUW6_9AGAR|nr:hypothetical protein IW261DRAFT_1596952 [Armillaria novae-zelandiae]